LTDARVTLAALGLVAVTLVAVPTAPPAATTPAPAVAAVAAAPPKPLSAGTVDLDAADIADGRVVATADVLTGLDDARVVFTSTGAVDVTGTDRPVPAGGPDPSTVAATVALDPTPATTDPVEAALADASGTTVVATLRATDAGGATVTASDTVWVDQFEGVALASESGEQDLRLQRVGVLQDEGTVSEARADELREQILGGGATATGGVAEGTCVGVCVSGTILWTDSVGGTHPVAQAPVEIRDEDGAIDEVLTTVTTDGTGHFAATVDADDGDATGRDLYIRVRADGPGFTIAQFMESPALTDVPAGSTVTRDLTANSVDQNNTAFSLQAALTIAAARVTTLHGSALPSIPVVFPATGSFYNGSSLNLVEMDRFDWDVILHEYGHFVADQLNIENNPGGVHRFSENLSDSRGRKVIGIRLAWGEGWPTYFAVRTLADVASGLGVPNAGDVRYQDTEDSTLDVSLEGPATLGEDNERTVMNALWDLDDAHPDGRDRLALGPQRVWDLIDAGDPTSLSEAYGRFSPNRRSEPVNCIFTDARVAPRLDGPVTAVARAAPPRLTWARGNGGTHPNNRFSVAFRSNGGTLLYASPFRTGQIYTPPAARWASIRQRAGGAVRVAVVGEQTDAPRTGPYRGCSRTFTVR
jgi:hypothetical protein